MFNVYWGIGMGVGGMMCLDGTCRVLFVRCSDGYGGVRWDVWNDGYGCRSVIDVSFWVGEDLEMRCADCLVAGAR